MLALTYKTMCVVFKGRFTVIKDKYTQLYPSAQHLCEVMKAMAQCYNNEKNNQKDQDRIIHIQMF